MNKRLNQLEEQISKVHPGQLLMVQCDHLNGINPTAIYSRHYAFLMHQGIEARSEGSVNSVSGVSGLVFHQFWGSKKPEIQLAGGGLLETTFPIEDSKVIGSNPHTGDTRDITLQLHRNGDLNDGMKLRHKWEDIIRTVRLSLDLDNSHSSLLPGKRVA